MRLIKMKQGEKEMYKEVYLKFKKLDKYIEKLFDIEKHRCDIAIYIGEKGKELAKRLSRDE